MAFPEVSVIDDFNRTNEGPPPSSNYTNIGTGFSVSSNKLNGSAGHRASYWSASIFDATQQGFITLATLNAEFSRFGVTFRMQEADPGDAYFVFGTSNNTVEVWKMVNGALDTQLGATISQTFAVGDSIGFAVEDNLIEIWYKAAAGSWTSLGTRTDSTYLTDGYVGIRAYSDNGIQLDDFGAGDFSGAPPGFVANAGLDQTRMELETVMLDSSQSTSPVGIASRLWEQVSGTAVTINNPTNVNPTFIAPDVASSTTLVFKVTITDTESATVEDQVSVTIEPTGSNAWLSHVPQEAGLDPDEFYAALDQLPAPSMVLRGGRVIGSKGDITTEGFTWSASKSLVAMIFARQLQLANVDYTDTVPSTGSPLATYEQMMAMVGDFNLTPHSPGDHYAYNNNGVHHYGTHLKDTFYAGNTHVQALQNAFVAALNFEDTLGYNTSGLMSGWDGGWSMSTRDLARICQLVLNNGLWNGTQIISADFVNRLYTCQIPDAATQSPDESNIQNNEVVLTVHLHGAYSFGFWLAQNHDFIGPPAMNEAISMIGAFGTTAHISRVKQLIVVACNVGGTTTNDATVAIPGDVFDLFADALPEQRSSSRLTRGSLHGFYDDEAVNRTEFWETAEADHELAPNGSPHSHIAANIALTQTHILTVQDGIHGHAVQNLALELPARGSGRIHRGASFEYFDDEALNRTEFWEVSTISSLTVQDVAHSHTANSPALTQAHSLAVQDAAHGHSVENATLTQSHALVVQGSSHALTSNNLALVQVHSLVVNGSSHAHAADNVVPTQAHQLMAQDAAHAHSAGNVALTQVHVLTVGSASHAHTSENVVLAVAGDLVVAGSTHQHTSESALLTQLHQLAVADSIHAHSAGNVILTQSHVITVANALHSQAAESLTITQDHQIAVANAVHVHTVDSPALTQVHSLTVNAATHPHSVENVGISSSDALGIQDATHSHSAQTIAITQTHNLIVSPAMHSHVTDESVLSQTHVLTVQAGSHAHISQNVILGAELTLTIASGVHSHMAQNVLFGSIARREEIKVFSETRTAKIGAESRAVPVARENRTI